MNRIPGRQGIDVRGFVESIRSTRGRPNRDRPRGRKQNEDVRAGCPHPGFRLPRSEPIRQPGRLSRTIALSLYSRSFLSIRLSRSCITCTGSNPGGVRSISQSKIFDCCGGSFRQGSAWDRSILGTPPSPAGSPPGLAVAMNCFEVGRATGDSDQVVQDSRPDL